MFEDFYNQLPIISKPYLIIIIILLISLEVTLCKFYALYKKAHKVEKEKEPPVFIEKEYKRKK